MHTTASNKGLLFNLFLLGCIVGGYSYMLLCDRVGTADIGIGCPMKHLTGLPCPGCGMGRATLLLLKGHFAAAFFMHPLSILFNAAMVLSLLLLLKDMMKGTDDYWTMMKRDASSSIKLILFGVIALCWVWNIYRGI